MGRITSDVVRGMSVTQFIGVGHIANSDCHFHYRLVSTSHHNTLLKAYPPHITYISIPTPS